MEAFQKKGYNVSLVTDSQTWIAQKPRSVPIYALRTLSKYNAHRRLVPNYLSLIRTFKQIKPDLVHIHTQYHYAPAVYYSVKIPYVLHCWGLDVLGLHQMSFLRRIMAEQVAAKASRIVVDAYCMKRIWKSTGISGNKIEVIPFGVDTNLFNPNANGKHIREEIGIGEDTIAIVSTRPFFDHYNIECLIKAIPIIVKAHRNVLFMIKGEGPLGSNIRRLAKKLHVEQHVRFSNPVPYHRMPQYLAAANIYVSPSFIDSTSVSLLEAMACGLPPVTTDIPGNREWVKDGINGLLYPPKDHGALSERIVRLIENEDLRKRFGERCFQEVKERAAWNECVSKMETIYQSVI